MIYFEGYIKQYREENGLSVIDKDQLLEKYGVKFLLYLYQDSTFAEEIAKIDKSSKDYAEAGRKIVEEYGELGLVKAIFHRTNPPKEVLESLSDQYYDLLYQDMMQKLI